MAALAELKQLKARMRPIPNAPIGFDPRSQEVLPVFQWTYDLLSAHIAALEDRDRLRAASPDDLRDQGWSVAVHTDYKLNREGFTFWLFTKGNSVIKGEGATDAIALNEVRARRAALEGRDG